MQNSPIQKKVRLRNFTPTNSYMLHISNPTVVRPFATYSHPNAEREPSSGLSMYPASPAGTKFSLRLVGAPVCRPVEISLSYSSNTYIEAFQRYLISAFTTGGLYIPFESLQHTPEFSCIGIDTANFLNNQYFFCFTLFASWPSSIPGLCLDFSLY